MFDSGKMGNCVFVTQKSKTKVEELKFYVISITHLPDNTVEFEVESS